MVDFVFSGYLIKQKQSERVMRYAGVENGGVLLKQCIIIMIE